MNIRKRDGVANVTLGGRTFPISRDLVEDAKGQAIERHVANLRKALLVMHAPRDQTVGIDHATAIFTAAKHPKSFVSLNTTLTICSRTAWTPTMLPR